MIWRVLVGTVSIVVTMLVLGYVAVTEQDRMTSFTTAYQSRDIENGAQLYESNCARCHGPNGQGGQGPPINHVELFNGTRTGEEKWTGTIYNFVYVTIAGGRPVASQRWATYNAAGLMPTFGQPYGGPLRDDQVKALTEFVMNWGEAYVDPTSGRIPAGTPTPDPNAAGSDITAELPAGDAARGEALVSACVACHVAAGGVVGPAWESAKSEDGKNIGQHAAERFLADDYTGSATTAEQYLYEAIVNPNAYITPPGTGGTWPAAGPSTMPGNYGATLTKQDMADIIAYLISIP
jgi:mono/diheme cytochrome c family protein